MKRILGLDLGTNSIGWAVVNEAENLEEKSSILKLGVRAIHFDTFVNSDTGKEVKGNPIDFYKSGKGVSPNAGRTQKRSARRNLQRYKLRRDNLIRIFKERGLITDETCLSESGNFSTFETYRLRAKAVEERITLEQFARVLLNINKKRGYKSSRKAKGIEDGTLIDGMEVAHRLYDENITPGELCYILLKQGKSNLPDFYASDLLAELDRIWENQRTFYPELLTLELKEKIKGRNVGQTESILTEKFVWEEVKSFWNESEGRTENIVEECRLVRPPRSVKGNDLKLENYEWRTKALKQKISLEELAVVIKEINKQINTSNGYLGNISDRSKVLYFNKQTIGQYLMSMLESNPNFSLKNKVFYRQDYLDEFDRIWETQSVYYKELTNDFKKRIRDEFIFYQRPLKSQKNLISYCEFESAEKNIILNDGRKKTILTGCKVAPRSSPLFQEFKIWQQLNNIEVFYLGEKRNKRKKIYGTPTLFDGVGDVDKLEIDGRRFLLQEEKEKLAKELSLKDKLEKTEILSLLFERPDVLDLNFKTIDGNKTGYALFKAYSEIMEISGHKPVNFKSSADDIMNQVSTVFNALGWNVDFLKFDSSKSLKEQAYYKLWHLLYSFEGDNTEFGNGKLVQKIMDWTKMPREYAIVIANVHFLEDYASLSSKAISNILPHLKEGNKYDVACTYAGYRHSKNSLTKEEIEHKELKEKLDILPKNSLRNPVVEKILNQMVNVVNPLIDKYGKFDEIRVELARELKKNAKERKLLSDSISKTTKLHEEYKKILQTEFGLSHVSRNDIIRYKLYEELKDNGYKTLYSDTYIPKDKLFSGEFDIEHIIPKARLFDDSLSNKTIELKSVNIDKGKMTAYDFVIDKYGEAEKYKNKCEYLFKDKKVKLKKLMMTESEIPDGFIERDLRNTQYIARFALSMLNNICRRVVATTGSITDKLREDWQLVDMMKELNWNKYKKLGLVEYFKDRDGRQIGRIKEWTKRNDHRHHAMDALTVAFTKEVFIQYFNNVNAAQQSGTNEIAIKNKYFHNGRAIPPIPLDEFRTEAKRCMQDLLISIKAKGKVVTNNITTNGKNKGRKIQQTPRGQLHLETIYGKQQRYVTKEEKVNVSFDEEKISKVAKKVYREALLNRLKEYNGDSKKAFTGKNSLDKSPIWLDELHLSKVPERVKLVFFEDIYTIRKDIDSSLNVDKVVDVKIRKMLQERIENEGNNGLSNLLENPIWLNEKKGISVKKVKITGISNAEAIHEKHDKEGKLILNDFGKPIPVDFVNTGNNHHVAIYKKPLLDKFGNIKLDEDGNVAYELDEVVVSFYEAVTRANQGLPVIDRNYKIDEGWQFLYSMKQNEYFVFPNYETGFNPKEIDLMNPDNYALISPNLFRVQKFSTKDYFFRHHLETTVEDRKELQNITWKRIKSMAVMNDIVKVRVNHIGEIVSIVDI